MNVWQQVIDHELVIAHLGVAKDDVSWGEARKVVSELIQWHVEVATNPQTNGGYELLPVEQSNRDEYGIEGF